MKPLYETGERVLVCTGSGDVRDIIVSTEYLNAGDIVETPTTRHKALIDGYFYRVCITDNDGIRMWHEKRLRKLPDASDYDFVRLMDWAKNPKFANSE